MEKRAEYRSRMAEARCDLNPGAGSQRFRQSLRRPTDVSIGRHVDEYWMVDWDLRGGQPYLHESLPDPAIHLVLQEGQSRLVGVCTGRFSYVLDGTGRIFGLRFRPGAFHSYIALSASAFTDSTIPLQDVFGGDGTALEAAIMSIDPAEECGLIAVVEDFLRSRRPAPDEASALVANIMDTVVADRGVRRVEDLVERFHVSRRTLQRLFSTYVGVNPKWVIKRHRLLEAADQLTSGEVADWAGLATSLGYFDQAHFVNDFTAIVGRSPAAHAKLVVAASSPS